MLCFFQTESEVCWFLKLWDEEEAHELLGTKTWRVLSGAKPRPIAAFKIELQHSLPHTDNLFHNRHACCACLRIMASLRVTPRALNHCSATFRPRFLRPRCQTHFPAKQTRWSSATTEPHQPAADGTTHGAPSSQKEIRFTSES